MDLVWGKDYLNIPPLKDWRVFHGYKAEAVTDRNLGAPEDWVAGRWEYAGRRNRATNHWWGFGAYSVKPDGSKDTKTPNGKWGLGYDGKRMVPGCYTGHPCLLNVLEDAKADFLSDMFRKHADNPQAPAGKAYGYRLFDVKGLWVEDTLNICQCEKCLTPIRLANGLLVTPDNQAFRGVQFYSNACAMIHAVNVHAKRNMKVESIGYFWMSSIPPFELSRNYVIRFCPYIRKNYAVPIYAPCNDLFWRDFYRWSQLDVELGLYEYFLFVGIRPWTDTYKYDLQAEAELGLVFATPECDRSALAATEAFALSRIFWTPDVDVEELRKFYLQRIFREAASAMEKFYTAVHRHFYRNIAENISMEFDEGEIGALAWIFPSDNGKGCVADELNGYLEEAKKAVRHPASKLLLEDFCKEWDKYIGEGRKNAETLR